MTDSPRYNRPDTDLPDRCDVLVVGAGPAGSACARWLALAGRDVVLVDSQAFPRDKTCGDGLVPDALAALKQLGLLEEVMVHAHPVSFAHCVGPRGGAVDVLGQMAVLPRRELDHILCKGAAAVGAQMFAPVRFVAPVEEAGVVVGARLSGASGEKTVRANWVVIATGASAPPLQAAGMCERRTPSGIALRGYVRHPAPLEAVDGLHFVWHSRIREGYGWVFPCGNNLYNVGVGVLNSHNIEEGDGRRSMKNLNLRAMFDAFCEINPLVKQLSTEGEWVTELKGAPLRCTLDGARLARPGMLVTGEAAGSTYAFTGEGIGKAMETGIAAARSVLEGGAPEAVRQLYTQRIDALRPRFEMYRKAASFNRYPWLVDMVIWRSKRSARFRAAMSGILNETRMPGSLISWRGLRRMILG